MFSFEAFKREQETRDREHKIKLARLKVQYWKTAESIARTEHSHSYGLIATFKKKRKQAESDLEYILAHD